MRAIGLMSLALGATLMSGFSYGEDSTVRYLKAGESYYLEERVARDEAIPQFAADRRGQLFARIDTLRTYTLKGGRWVPGALAEGAVELSELPAAQRDAKRDSPDFIGVQWSETKYVKVTGMNADDLKAFWRSGAKKADLPKLGLKAAESLPEGIYHTVTGDGSSAETEGNKLLWSSIRKAAYPADDASKTNQ